ncbi:MAG TPA: BON domain-containing protein [Verrucomicrobiae bacterium]|nr:BON domain-containing protein [Verrucomicrobiae bacterium]
MKVILALIVGIAVGAAAVWFYGTNHGKSALRTTGDQIQSATKNARDTIQEKLKVLDLRPDEIKDDLARTGKVVRRKAREAGQAFSDATSDARVTGAIKAKLVASQDLSAMSISVNTTDGIVTLSGSVDSADEIGKAMLLAMETDGVREVVSTLHVKGKAAPKAK